MKALGSREVLVVVVGWVGEGNEPKMEAKMVQEYLGVLVGAHTSPLGLRKELATAKKAQDFVGVD